MKKSSLFFLFTFLISCSNSKIKNENFTWEKEFEQITKIEFPKGYKVLLKPDSINGQRVKKAKIKLSENECRKFTKDYDFTTIKDTVSPVFFGTNLMDSIYENLSNRNQLLHLYGKKPSSPKYFKYNTEQAANWVYFLDTVNCDLTCIISFADLSGYVK